MVLHGFLCKVTTPVFVTLFPCKEAKTTDPTEELLTCTCYHWSAEEQQAGKKYHQIFREQVLAHSCGKDESTFLLYLCWSRKQPWQDIKSSLLSAHRFGTKSLSVILLIVMKQWAGCMWVTLRGQLWVNRRRGWWVKVLPLLVFSSLFLLSVEKWDMNQHHV